MGKERFLLWLLASIFFYQAALFTYGVHECSLIRRERIANVCSDIGERYDTTFAVMISTTLALLTGNRFGSRY